MAEAAFVKALRGRDEITISVIGRKSKRIITLPVWCVLEGHTLWLLPVRGSRSQWYRNLLANPAITIRAGRLRRSFTAHPVRPPRTVKTVVRKFRARYTPEEVARYYSIFDAAVKVPVTG
ncbi:MAG: nitroreductase family deazaflavin-dependent oxidoreductase [Armatimonadetes bacterium]|nr:nitroreductase family deazaflavin-dependent oxidoreductase [Armatimonadota bacterium]